MGKQVRSPKRNIISCRVNDQEMQTLQEVARRAGINISDLLRHTLNMLEQDYPRAANG